MEKLSDTIQAKNKQKPQATKCKRCGELTEPKEIPIIGWRQQEYCEKCEPIVREECRQKEAETNKKQTIAALLARSGIMRGRLAEMTFDSFNEKLNPNAYKLALKYADGFNKETKQGLMLYGKAGTGKTHIAVAIARYLIEQKQIPVLFARTVDLLMEIRKTYNEDERYRTESEAELIAKYAKAPLLILDDIGSEKTTDWVKQILYLIIDERWIEQRPMILTSNLSLEQIEQRVEERLASRIAGLCAIFEMTGTDQRPPK